MEHGLRLASGGRELVITDCLEKLRRFCKHDAYPYYDVVGYACEDQPYHIQVGILDATNKAMLARSSRKAWLPFLDTPLAELKAIPAHVDLVDSNCDEYSKAREALRQLYGRLANVTWITDMAASKVLHLKRPRLVAISDSYIREALGVKDRPWKGYASRGAYFADRGIDVLDAVRAVGQVNKSFLDDLQKQLEPIRLEKARIIDILVWADMAIPTHPGWSKAAREKGWTSIAWQLRNEDPMGKLYERIFSAGCIKFGEFRLKSGIMSPVYCDFRGLVSKPELLREIGQALGEKAKQIGWGGQPGDRIAGIPYAGLPLGVAASLASGIPMIYPRKEAKDYGTKKLIEGEYNEGDRVLVIDDIITDGASKIEAIEPLKEAGLVVTDVLIILDREQGGDRILAKAGYKLHSLGKLSEVLDALVAAGKVEPGIRAKVAEFVAANQFA